MVKVIIWLQMSNTALCEQMKTHFTDAYKQH